MKRLRDETPADPTGMYTAQLLRAYRPLAESSPRRRQIRRALEARPHSMRPALARGLAVVFLLSTLSAAAKELWLLLSVPSKRPTPAALPSRSEPRETLPTVRPEAPVYVPPSATVVSTASSASSVRLIRSVSQAAKRPRGHASPVAAPTRGIEDLDAAKLLSAIHALRIERRPEEAEALIKEYRARHPHSPLSEESLALAIEAAALANRRHTAELAAEYLARFPAGRFTELALTARQHFAR